MIGSDDINGKELVIEACDKSANYLASVKTTFDKFKKFVSGNTIVIDSAATYEDKESKISIVSSCDIYEFEEGKLIEITNYNIGHSHKQKIGG